MKKMIIQYQFSPHEEKLEYIIHETKKKFKSKKIPYMEAVEIALCELIENAIKYGGCKSDKNHIDVAVHVNKGKISVNVSNYLVDKRLIRNVEKHIKKIKESTDPFELYVNRIHEISQKKNLKNIKVLKLGLIRIVYEGKFSIDYVLRNNTLTVVAERNYK